MDLSDQILVRGWVNHLSWEALDAQLPDDSEPAKRKVKHLRQQLLVKSRFYGKSELVDLWGGGRGTTQIWQDRCLKALAALNRWPDPVPDLGQGIAQWFDERVCIALPNQVKTLQDLANHLESINVGDIKVRDTLKPNLKKLTRFFDENVQQLGYQLKKKPVSTTLPVPLSNVAPLEHVEIPIRLNGEQGSNRSTEPVRINATHDLDAIKSWLSQKDDNAKTYNAYKKELERVLLWAVLERGKAFSSLNTDDCKAYIYFIKTLTVANSQWVTQQPAIKGQGKWKPFYYRSPKSRIGVTDKNQDSPPPAKVLSPRSVNYAKTVISSCMDWLVKQHYLKHNNFDGIASIKFAQAKLQTTHRAFTFKQMQAIFAYAEARVNPDESDYYANRRTLFLLKLAFSTGLRIHELAAASFGDIECLEDDTGVQYYLKVVGKHSKERKTSLPEAFIEELKSYLKLRNLPTHFDFLPQQAPLIPSLRDKTKLKHLSPAGIHTLLADFFKKMAEELQDGTQADIRLANKLSKASTHWLRHSYGSYLANDKQIPLTYIRDELGHANISTTSLYLNADIKQRQKVVSEAFFGV